MIFRTGGSISKRIIYMQIAALVLMLVGWWHLGLIFFILASVMALKSMNQAQQPPSKPNECIISKEAIDAATEATERQVVREQEKRHKEHERETKKAERAKWQTVVEATVLTDYKEMKLTDIPNGFVIMGPADKPVLVDFDEKGKLVSKGVEVEISNWLTGLGDKLPEDVVVLVHSIQGDDQMLIKSLEVNRILKDGKKVTVKEAARLNLLPQVVEALREKYLDNMRSKEVESLLENVDGDAGRDG